MTTRDLCWPRRMVSVALGLTLVHLLVTSIGLNFGLFPRLLNASQKDVVLDYDVAWSLIPGLVSVRGLRLRGQDSSVEWQLTADRVTAAINLLDLPRKRFRVVTAYVTGATFRLRERREAETLCEPEAARLPSIAGYFNPLEPGGDRLDCLWRASEEPPIRRGARPDPQRLWKVHLANIQGEDLREVWIEGYRLRGRARVAGGFDFWPTQRLAVTPSSLVVRSGTVSYDLRPVAEGLDVHASMRLDESNIEAHSGAALLGGLTVSATVGAGLKSLGFLNGYLRAVDTLRFDGGSGALIGQVAIERGVIRPGTQLAIFAPQVRARLFDQHAVGSGTIRWDTRLEGESPVGRLDVELSHYALYGGGSKTPHVEGRGMTLRASSRELDLVKPFSDLDARLELPPARVASLRDYESYLPPGLGLEVLAGSATIEGELRITAGDHVDTGRLVITARHIGLRYRGLVMRGGLAVHTRVQDGDLGVPRLHIHGTRVELRDVSLLDDESRKERPEVERWWGRVTVPRGVLTPGKDRVLDADLHVEMRDIRPLLAVYAETHALPEVAQEALAVEDVEGETHLTLGKGLMDVSALRARGGGLTVNAVFLSAGDSSRGALFLDLGAVKLSLALEGEDTRFHLFDAAEAFRTERARVDALRRRLGLARSARDEDLTTPTRESSSRGLRSR